jgi:two-component system sensor histidine kinase NreB
MAGLVWSLGSSMDRLETEHVARRALARRTLWASERERNRLAAELHDGPVQQLTAFSYRLEALRAKLVSDGRSDSGFEVVQQQLSTEVAGLRQLMTALRPGALVERGLEAPIRDHVAKTLKGLPIVPHVYVDLPCRPDQEIETIVYRVVQDAIANAVRSAHATMLDISLSQKGEVLCLRVSHDGHGSLPETSDLGLLSMKERIELTDGRFLVSGTEGAGTTIEAEVPMRGTP